MSLSTSKQIVGLIAWLAVSFVAAAIGGIASMQAGSLYAQLIRPDWAPPSDLFGPVWTVFYALMGIAAWLVWRVGGFRAAKMALALFLVQLAINALWSWLFFRWKLGALAFADIVLLWLLIVATTMAFWRISFWPERCSSRTCYGSALHPHSITLCGSSIRSCWDRCNASPRCAAH